MSPCPGVLRVGSRERILGVLSSGGGDRNGLQGSLGEEEVQLGPGSVGSRARMVTPLPLAVTSPLETTQVKSKNGNTLIRAHNS